MLTWTEPSFSRKNSLMRRVRKILRIDVTKVRLTGPFLFLMLDITVTYLFFPNHYSTELQTKHQESRLLEILHTTFLHNTLSDQCPSVPSSQITSSIEDRARAYTDLVSTVCTVVQDMKQSNKDRSRELGVDYSQLSKLSTLRELFLSVLLQDRQRQSGIGSGDSEGE
jgi:hypothetical protein